MEPPNQGLSARSAAVFPTDRSVGPTELIFNRYPYSPPAYKIFSTVHMYVCDDDAYDISIYLISSSSSSTVMNVVVCWTIIDDDDDDDVSSTTRRSVHSSE